MSEIKNDCTDSEREKTLFQIAPNPFVAHHYELYLLQTALLLQRCVQTQSWVVKLIQPSM